MSSEKYIGLDVHQATISVAVVDSQGKLIMESILETKGSTLLEFFAGLRGSLFVTFEEGTWAKATSAEQLAVESGGESANFSDPDGLENQLLALAGRIDNEYILSFTPTSRQSGLHTIAVQIDKRVAAKITARKTYWLENTSEH
jgi:hypothetical protein